MFPLIFVHVTFLRVLYNIHHHISFAEELTNSTAAAAAATADLHPFVTHTGLTVKTALFLFLIVTHSSSMKGPRLNFHADRQLAGRPKTTCFCKVEFQPFQTVALTADVFQLLDKLQSSTPNRNPPELLVKHTSHIHNLFRYRRQHNARVFFSYSCTLLF